MSLLSITQIDFDEFREVFKLAPDLLPPGLKELVDVSGFFLKGLTGLGKAVIIDAPGALLSTTGSVLSGLFGLTKSESGFVSGCSASKPSPARSSADHSYSAPLAIPCGLRRSTSATRTWKRLGRRRTRPFASRRRSSRRRGPAAANRRASKSGAWRLSRSNRGQRKCTGDFTRATRTSSFTRTRKAPTRTSSPTICTFGLVRRRARIASAFDPPSHPPPALAAARYLPPRAPRVTLRLCNRFAGKKTTQDEMGTAAYKTVELDDLLDGVPIQHREVMMHESAQFKGLFKAVSYLKGGVASAFNHVEPNAYISKLLHVKKVGKTTSIIEVPCKRDSLNEGDAFVLDTGATIYVWAGSGCSPFVRPPLSRSRGVPVLPLPPPLACLLSLTQSSL